MKKTLVLAMAISLFTATMGFSQKNTEAAPTVNPGETLLDRDSISGKVQDNIRLVSGVEGEKTFIVKYYNSKKNNWVVFGSAALKYFGDTSFIGSSVHVRSHRWYSIKAEDGGNYRYDLSTHHKDMYITVYPLEKEAVPDKGKATIFEAGTIKGSFRDNIRILNMTEKTNIPFVVYGFNNQDEEWTKIGNATLKNINEDAMVRTPLDKVNAFKFYAFIPKDGGEYKLSAAKKDHDLFITASN